MIELKLYKSFAQTRPYDNVNNYVSKDETPGPEGEYSPLPHSPSLTQHRLIRNFQTIELMEMLKITVLVHVRIEEAKLRILSGAMTSLDVGI